VGAGEHQREATVGDGSGVAGSGFDLVGPENPHAGRFQSARQLQWRLPAELHDHAERLLALDDLQHVLERQWFEVQLVRRVEVGGDGLGVRVDHDGLVPLLA
jgi:hypothetical protein